jgi:hypothetical protein
MTAQLTAETVFGHSHSPLANLPSGVLLHAEPRRSVPGWLNLGEQLGGQVLHRGSAAPASAAVGMLTMTGVSAAVVHRAQDGRQTWLALRFALHLAERRRAADPLPVAPCATCTYRPGRLPAGVVRIPHLVAGKATAGRVVDQVVWELMAADDAVTWIGGPLPDQEWFEERLPRLLALRARVRTGQIGDNPAAVALMGLLRDRYLSIRFAYQHAGLIADVLNGPTGERRSA